MEDKYLKYKDEYDNIYLDEKHMEDVAERLGTVKNIKSVIQDVDNILKQVGDDGYQDRIIISTVNYRVQIDSADIDRGSLIIVLEDYKNKLGIEKKGYMRLNPDHKDY